MADEVLRDEFSDPLSMDISRDLRRIDRVTTRILQDDRIWDDYIRDPNGVMVRFGMHAPTTKEINDGANRAIYAALANQKLQDLISEHFSKFNSDYREEYRQKFEQGLREGRIEYDINFDLEGAWHLLDDERVFREAMLIMLDDFNERGLLKERHERSELESFVKQLTQAVRDRRPISEHPQLEEYDLNYGIGPQLFCSALVECAAVATLGIGVEGASAVTAIVDVGFWGFTAETLPGQAGQVEAPVVADIKVVSAAGLGAVALAGNEEAVRKLDIMGRLAKLTGDMITHIHNFERRPPVRSDEVE